MYLHCFIISYNEPWHPLFKCEEEKSKQEEMYESIRRMGKRN